MPTQKILTSKNFIFLTSQLPELEEEILIRNKEGPSIEGEWEDIAEEACSESSNLLSPNEGEHNPSQ